jgi:hypothetical protein
LATENAQNMRETNRHHRFYGKSISFHIVVKMKHSKNTG